MADLSRASEKRLNEALALIHFGFRKMVEEPDRLLAKRGFGRVHHRVLYFVARRPHLSVGDLLAILDVSKQSLHRPMQELLREGLLASSSDSQNRRIKRLYLTPAGALLEEKLSGIQRALFARIFGARGEQAARQWRAIMHDLGEGRAEQVFEGT